MRKPWIIAAFLIVGILAYGLFRAVGLSGRILISPQTTFITSPLAEDGLPDYVQAALDRLHLDISADDNAAAFLWQVVDDTRVDSGDIEALFQELGIERAATRKLVFVDSPQSLDALLDWLASSEPTASRDDAVKIVTSASSHPWSDAEFPPLARWLAENSELLNRVVEGASRPEFYSPPPNLLTDHQTPLMEATLPHIDLVRRSVRSLLVRMMHRLKLGQYQEAWRDGRACLQLARHANQGTLVESQIAQTLHSAVLSNALHLLDVEDLPADVADQILADVEVPLVLDVAGALEGFERLSLLDTTLHLTTNRFKKDLGIGTNGADVRTMMLPLSDLNVSLRMVNAMFDRIADAAAIADPAARDVAYQAIENELRQMERAVKSKRRLALFDREGRGQRLGEIVLSLLTPNFRAATEGADQSTAIHHLTQVAAALKRYRLTTGKFPESVEALVPDVLAEMPLDPYADGPFRYERRDNGYVLYSASAVEVDATEPPEDVALDQSDLVISMPRASNQQTTEQQAQ
jgi:hypothetical protein